VLYAGTTEGLWKSADAGKSWARISPADWIVNALLLAPNRESSGASRLVIGTERQGVVVSDDGGLHFRAANEGFFHRRVLAVAVDSRDARRVAAVLSNAPEAVVVSEDGGATWTTMDEGLGGASVRSIYSAADGWWAALTAGGLARYDDAKQRWMRAGMFLQDGSQTAREDIAPEAGHGRPVVNDVFTSGTAWLTATDQGLFESRDQGRTWNALRFGPGELPVQSVRASADGRSAAGIGRGIEIGMVRGIYVTGCGANGSLHFAGRGVELGQGAGRTSGSAGAGVVAAAGFVASVDGVERLVRVTRRRAFVGAGAE